jgi:hypothetical protein
MGWILAIAWESVINYAALITHKPVGLNYPGLNQRFPGGFILAGYLQI